MLKLSRNGIGVLTSQYRSVLKKCALLNMLVAGAFMFAAPANASEVNPESLKEMGTVNADNMIFVNGRSDDMTLKRLFTDIDGPTEPAQHGWIINYRDLYFGVNTTHGPVTTEISNKHSLFGQQSSMMPAQGGGVVSNHPSDDITGAPSVFTVTGVTFKNNSVTNFKKYSTGSADMNFAVGGVLSNVSAYNSDYQSPSDGAVLITGGSKFTNNYTMHFDYALGGAIFNGVEFNFGTIGDAAKTISEGTVFSYNHTGNEDMYESPYSEVSGDAARGSEVDTKITQAWKSEIPSAQATHPDGLSYYSRGGAIFNIGTTEITDNTFNTNYSRGINASGGAIYNSDRLYGNTGDPYEWINEEAETDIIGNNTFTNNFTYGKYLAVGGAIFNDAKIVISDKDGLISSTFEENHASSEINAQGGAIYNTRNKDHTKGAEMGWLVNANFRNNYVEATSKYRDDEPVAYGGAIANSAKLMINDGVFENNKAMTSVDNTSAVSYGGAIYNLGELIIGGSTYDAGDMEFYNNKAEGYKAVGGAIFNGSIVYAKTSTLEAGEITGTIQNKMIFTGNKDAQTVYEGKHFIESAGGAIYGEPGTKITINLTGTGNITFSKYNMDNVYMSPEGDVGGGEYVKHADAAVFTIIGDNPAPVVRSSSTTNTSAIDENHTMVNVGSTFTGEGKYVIKNTQLNIKDGTEGGTGFIGFMPNITMSDTVVNMGGSDDSYFGLSSNNDTLSNNDFYITNPSSVLYYADYDSSSNFVLANYIDNSGAVVYDDMPQNDKSSTLVGVNLSTFYPDARSTGDTDIRIANTFVNKSGGMLITSTDGFLTKRIHVGTLESAGGRIFVNMNNTNLINTDSEHKLIPEAPEGYEFGTYTGQHYDAEVIVVDNKATGEAKIVFMNLENVAYTQVNLDVGQRIYFAQTQTEAGLTGYSWNIENAVNDNYEIKIGYDENGTVYDWFLYRGKAVDNKITPEEMVAISIPRSTLEQIRSVRLPLDKTNRGQCSCYKDNCDNSFCQYEPGSAKTRLWATPFYRQGTFDKPFEVDFKLVGVDAGIDFQPTSTDMIGVFGSYRYGKYENDGNQKHFGDKNKYFSDQGGELELKTISAGLYYRKYIKNLYLLGAVYAGKIDADIKADNGVKGSLDGKFVGAQAEVGYDIKTTRRSTLTPSLRGTYDYIKYDKGRTNNGKQISIGKINSFELEAALKLEYQFNNENQLPTTGYIKPSVIQTIPDGGKVKVDKKEYKKTLDNETLGRIEIGADTNLTTSFSIGAFGNYTFGADYEAWGIGGNLKYVF